MKFLAVPILILLLLTQTFSKWIVIMNYEANKEYIAKKLCENRNRPQLHCDGKCQLAQKIKATENEESPLNNQPLKVKMAESIFITESLQEFLQPRAIALSRAYNSRYLIVAYSSPHAAVFHPPAIS